MAIEKGLIIKSLLGVSAVGGGVTVVAVGHKEGWLSTLGTTTTSDAGQGGAGGAGTGDTGQSGVSGSRGESGQPQTTESSTSTQTAGSSSQNKKFEELKLPSDCDFSEDSEIQNNPKKCDVTKDTIVKIAFKDKDDADLTIEAGQDDFTGMKLVIKKLSDEEKNHYDNSIEYTFTFKDFSKTVTLKKSDGTTEVVKLVKDTNPEFKKTDDNKLERIWKEEGSFCQKVGITYSDNNAKITKDSEIPFLEGDQIKKYKLKDESSSDITVTVAKGEEGFNQGFKLSVSNQAELKINDESVENETTKTLETTKNYQILFKEGASGGWYLAEKTEAAEK